MDQIIPKALIISPRNPKDFTKGINSPIPYVVRNTDADWTPYLPSKEPQKYKFDTNECWDLSMINSVETQCNFLKTTGGIPQESLDWFTKNGYFDANGNFAFSERFLYALSGVHENGNNQWEAWRLSSKIGLLPRSMFMYTMDESLKFASQHEMCRDYGDTSKITDSMRQIALQCLQYINIAYEWVGKEGVMPDIRDIKAMLYQSPLQIGIPVCMATYNSGNVVYCGLKDPGHAITLITINSLDEFSVFDHYNPYIKNLSSDYLIPLVTHGVVTPILNPIEAAVAKPYPQTIWTRVWTAVAAWFSGYYS